MKIAKHLLLAFILVSAAVAAEKEIGPHKPFRGYANQLVVAASKEAKGSISDEQFQGIAIELFKYLEGEPAQNQKLRARIQSTGEDKTKVVVFVSYDYGIGFLGYDFAFNRKWMALESITVVPSE